MENQIVDSKTGEVISLVDGRGKHFKNNEYGRKHTVDYTFFDVIDNEDKAYWLGFISADGFVYYMRGRPSGIGIRLAEKDKDHLTKFRDIIGSTHSVGREETYTERAGLTVSYRIRVYSYQIGEALIKLGLTQHKGQNNSPCQLIPKELMRHYWRGVFDGDGSIGANGTISLYGTKEMIQGFIDWCRVDLKVLDIRLGMSRSVYQCQIGSKRRNRILYYLYYDSKIYLDRKYKLYKQFNIVEEMIK